MKKSKTYTPEKKKEILAFAADNSVSAAEKKFGVTSASIRNWKLREIADLQAQKKAEKQNKVEMNLQNKDGPVMIEVAIPQHVVEAAAARYFEKKLSLKLVQF